MNELQIKQEIESIKKDFRFKSDLNIEKMFKQVQPIIKKKSRWVSRHLRINYEEIYSDACMKFVELFNDFDPYEKPESRFDLYFYNYMNSYFYKNIKFKYIKKKSSYLGLRIDFSKNIPYFIEFKNPENEMIVELMKSELNPDCKKLVDSVLKGELFNKTKNLKYDLNYQAVKKVFGWTYYYFKKVIQELRFWYKNNSYKFELN